MPNNTYKLIEIVGVSEDSIQQAVRNGLEKASQTLRHLDWFEVTQIRGAIRDDRTPVFQVEMKVGFQLLDRDVLEGGPDRPRKAKASKSKSNDGADAAAAKAGRRDKKKKKGR